MMMMTTTTKDFLMAGNYFRMGDFIGFALLVVITDAT